MIKTFWFKSAHATAEAVVELNALMKQLNPSRKKGTISELKRMARDPMVAMRVARDGQRIVGVSTLYTFQKMGKKLAHIDDIVVENAYRGQRIGEELVRSLVKEAKKRHVASLYVTSGDARAAANKLYKKVGFTHRPTNPYHLVL